MNITLINPCESVLAISEVLDMESVLGIDIVLHNVSEFLEEEELHSFMIVSINSIIHMNSDMTECRYPAKCIIKPRRIPRFRLEYLTSSSSSNRSNYRFVNGF